MPTPLLVKNLLKKKKKWGWCYTCPVPLWDGFIENNEDRIDLHFWIFIKSTQNRSVRMKNRIKKARTGSVPLNLSRSNSSWVIDQTVF